MTANVRFSTTINYNNHNNIQLYEGLRICLKRRIHGITRLKENAVESGNVVVKAEHNLSHSFLTQGDCMKIWGKIKDMIFGYEIMTVTELREKCKILTREFDTALSKMCDEIDANKNGMVSVREATELIKATWRLIKTYIRGILG